MFGEIFGYLVMLGILSTLIIVHECGHFSVARFFGFQTPVFGFGLPFGPHVVVGRKWGTEFRIHALLLGGFVAIPELGDETNQEGAFGVDMQPFRKFPIWQRALVAFAGVGFNIIFAYLIMLFMFLNLGQPTQQTAVHGLPPSNPIAAKAGIKPGDIIVAVDDKKVNSQDDVVSFLGQHKSELVHITVSRDAKPLTLAMTTNEKGKVGMELQSKGPVTYKKIDDNFFSIAWLAAVKLWTLTHSMIDALGDMVTGLFAGKSSAGHPAVGIQDLHGVLAVIKIGHDILPQDPSQLLLFTIMISMDLAIINLFPWPALDGGHLAFMTFEALRGRPMGERAQGEIVKWGFISLLVLMAVIMVNDVSALLQGKLDFKKEKQQRDADEAKGDQKSSGAKGNDAQSKPSLDAPANGVSAPSEPSSANTNNPAKTSEPAKASTNGGDPAVSTGNDKSNPSDNAAAKTGQPATGKDGSPDSASPSK